MEHFITIDVGTTAIKVGLFDRIGRLKHLVRREYELDTARSNIVEMEAEHYWQYTLQAMRRLVDETEVPKSQILSIAIASQGETLVPVGEDGRPLRRAIVWLDNRSRAECDELRTAFGLIRATGQNEIIPTWPATRLLWIRKNEPEIFTKTAKFLLLEDYLIYKLTGAFVGEYSLYTSSYLLDITQRRWMPEVLDFIGIDPEQLPSLREPGTVIGGLRPETCTELGLDPATRIVTGAMDQAASVVGAGGITENVTVETTGTVLSVCRTLDEFDETAHRGHPVHYHAVAGKYHSIDWCPTGGKSLAWLRDLLSPRTPLDFDEFTAASSKVAPGSEGLKFFPFLSGLGTFGPVSESHGAFVDIELHHGQHHFIRSVLESVAFLIRRNLETARLHSEQTEIRSLGGGAASSLWNQIKADATGKRIVTLECNESSSLGIAMVQAVACGVYGNFEEAASQMVRKSRTFEPDEDRSRRYDELYSEYASVMERLYSY